MTLEDAELELEVDCFNELVNQKVIQLDDEYIYIDFLDEQYTECEKTSEKGKLYALKRWNPKEYKKVMGMDTESQPNNHPMGTHSQPNAEKRREEKTREEWFITWFNDSMKGVKGTKGKFKLISKVKSQLHARIKEGYKSEDFKHALKAISRNDYHKEKNFQYLTPEFITRASSLEKWANVEVEKLAEEKGKGSGGVSMEELYHANN